VSLGAPDAGGARARRYGALNVQAGTLFCDSAFQREVAAGTMSSASLDQYTCVALAGVTTGAPPGAGLGLGRAARYWAQKGACGAGLVAVCGGGAADTLQNPKKRSWAELVCMGAARAQSMSRSGRQRAA
jgi:hypothetical protein